MADFDIGDISEEIKDMSYNEKLEFLEDLGYDENEDNNVDALLFQLGLDGYPIEVTDGEKLKYEKDVTEA